MVFEVELRMGEEKELKLMLEVILESIPRSF
jgi:hypothetical protein